MLADAENIEADSVGELNLFQQVLHALDGRKREPRSRVRYGRCEAVNADFHLCDSFNAVHNWMIRLRFGRTSLL
jgi:predicted ABC-type transport system involved in lysophospholipase L1 biosynthesis ATPase subunit